MQHAYPILVDPEIMQGTPCFTGTRVPVTTLFDYLEDGTIDGFLEDHPSVTRELALAVLEIAREVVPKNARIA